MKKQNLERLTVLVPTEEIKLIKHFAVDRGQSTSRLVRAAVGDWLRRQPTEGVTQLKGVNR